LIEFQAQTVICNVQFRSFNRHAMPFRMIHARSPAIRMSKFMTQDLPSVLPTFFDDDFFFDDHNFCV
jgi:hypothetical protein